MNEKVKKLLLSLTYTERSKREFTKFKAHRERYVHLTDLELRHRLVEAKVKYNKNRNVAVSLTVSLFLAIIMGACGSLLNLIVYTLQMYVTSITIDSDVFTYQYLENVIMSIIMLVGFFLIYYVTHVLIMLSKLSYTHRDLLIIQDVIDEKLLK